MASNLFFSKNARREIPPKRFSNLPLVFYREALTQRRDIYLGQGSQTQFTRGTLEAVFGCGRAAIGIPQKSSESILKCPY